MNYSISPTENSFKVLFTLNPHPRWIVDSRTLQFLEVNHAATKEYGYSREEFLSMTLENLCVVEDLPNLYRIQETEFDKESSYYKEAIHKLKNGELVYREVVSYKIDFEGKAARLALIHDVTERRLIEKQLNVYITELEEIAFYNSHHLRKPISKLVHLANSLPNTADSPAAKEIAEIATELQIVIQEINKKLQKVLNS